MSPKCLFSGLILSKTYFIETELSAQELQFYTNELHIDVLLQFYTKELHIDVCVLSCVKNSLGTFVLFFDISLIRLILRINPLNENYLYLSFYYCLNVVYYIIQYPCQWSFVRVPHKCPLYILVSGP